MAATAGPSGAACEDARFEGSAFTVCHYDVRVDELRMAWRGSAGPVDSLAGLRAELGRDAGRVLFAMNAGMFDPGQTPVGLYIKGGRVLHPLNQGAGVGNFFLVPNGVFWVDGRGKAHIDETSAFAAAKPQALWATQSGPLLVGRGALNPSISANGRSLAIRNAVGVRGDKAEFVISAAPVSFGRLARFLRDGLGCRDALYLDGAISSLWAPSLGRMDRRRGLGTFVAVLRR